MTKHTYLIFNSGTDNCDGFPKISVLGLNFGQDFGLMYGAVQKSFQYTSHYLFITVLFYRSVKAFLTSTLSDQSILT